MAGYRSAERGNRTRRCRDETRREQTVDASAGVSSQRGILGETYAVNLDSVGRFHTRKQCNANIPSKCLIGIVARKRICRVVELHGADECLRGALHNTDTALLAYVIVGL